MELSNLSSSIVRVGSKTIPAIGFGTYLLKGDTGLNAMKHAIKVGYRHIDTAHLYDNEELVGKAVKESITEGVLKSRDEIFITSKLGTIWHDPKKIPKVIQVRKKILLRAAWFTHIFSIKWTVWDWIILICI